MSGTHSSADEYRFLICVEDSNTHYLSTRSAWTIREDTHIVGYHEDRFTSLSRKTLLPAPSWVHIKMF